MSDSIMIPLQVYGLGFLISLGIAVMIKVILYSIRFFTKGKGKESAQPTQNS